MAVCNVMKARTQRGAGRLSLAAVLLRLDLSGNHALLSLTFLRISNTGLEGRGPLGSGFRCAEARVIMSPDKPPAIEFGGVQSL